MPALARLAGRALIASAAAALVASAAVGSDARMRKVHCYGLNPGGRAVEAQADRSDDQEAEAKAKKPRKKKKDYKVMLAQDCAAAGGRLVETR